MFVLDHWYYESWRDTYYYYNFAIIQLEFVLHTNPSSDYCNYYYNQSGKKKQITIINEKRKTDDI